MRAGTLDRQIAIFTAGIVTNDGGDDVDGFSSAGAIPASVRPAPGSERLASGENAANAPTVFRIRWSPAVADLNAKDRVEYPVGSGRMYDIKSVVEIGRREGLEIAAIGRSDQ